MNKNLTSIISWIDSGHNNVLTRIQKEAHLRGIAIATRLDTLNTTHTQLLQVNKNLQALLDAMLTNNQNEGEIRLMIDGKQVSRVIQRRSDNTPEGTIDGAGGG